MAAIIGKDGIHKVIGQVCDLCGLECDGEKEELNALGEPTISVMTLVTAFNGEERLQSAVYVPFVVQAALTQRVMKKLPYIIRTASKSICAASGWRSKLLFDSQGILKLIVTALLG